MSKTIKFLTFSSVLVFITIVSATFYLWHYRVSLIQDQAIPRLESILGFSINGDVKEVSLTDGLIIKNLSLGPKDKPVLRAREASLNIPLLEVIANKLSGRHSSEFVISEVTLDKAMLSARRSKEGKFIFFPESKDPNEGKREKEADTQTSLWKIKTLKVSDSDIEIEDRTLNKQISVSSINLNIEDLGNSSKLNTGGAFKLFIRDPGIDTFDPNSTYKEAFFTNVELDKLSLSLSEKMIIETGEFETSLLKTVLFLNSKSIAQDSLDLEGSLKHNSESNSDWLLENLNISGKNSTFSLKIPSSLNLTKLNFSEIDYTLNITDFDLTKLSIIGLDFNGILTSQASGKVSRAKIKTNLAVDLKDKELKILKASGDINLSTNQKSNESIIKLKFEEFNFDKLKDFYKPKANNKSLEPIKNLKIHWPYAKTEIDLDIRNTVFHTYRIDEIKLLGEVNPNEANLNKITLRNDKNIIKSNFVLNFNYSQDYKLNLEAEKIDIESLKVLYDELENRGLRGQIQNLKITASGSSSDSDILSKTLNANLNFDADDIYMPKELMDVPPFNIIFLPFTAVSSAFSLIPKEILPNDLISAGVGISDAVKDLQTFKLAYGNFDLKIADETVFLEEIKLGTSISGDLYFSGLIKFNKEIEINSGVSLLSVRVPLPITGTLDSPRPDVTQFVKGIFTEFGLSVLKLPVSFFSGIGDLFSSKSEKNEEKEKREKTDSSKNVEEVKP